MRDQLIQLAIQEAPAIIAYLRSVFAADNPDSPVPGDKEIFLALEAAFADSNTRDEMLRAALLAELALSDPPPTPLPAPPPPTEPPTE